MAANDEGKSTSSATWKFEFADTVQADPMAKGGCLAVIRSYLHFASKEDPKAFCSLPELEIRTGLSKPAIRRAKELLTRLGYMQELFVTEEGATMYKLVNARKEMIDDHIQIAREKLAADRRDRKRRERRMKRVKETLPPEVDIWERNVTPVENETLPNTVEEYRRVSCSEGRGGLIEEEPLSSSRFYDPIPDEVPFDIPSDEHEAEIMLDEIRPFIGNVNGAVLASLKRKLMSGELSPAYLSQQFGGGHGSA